MLYLTTRDIRDAHTAHKALTSDFGADGGVYVPFKLPAIEPSELALMRDQTFGEIVAKILNLFFSANITGWDVDFCVGRAPIKTVTVSRKVVIGELWHNPISSYAYLEKNLFTRIIASNDCKISSWAAIAIKIAILFATYGQMLRSEQIHLGTNMDVAVPLRDMTDPIAAIYAKRMGLPVEHIVLCTDDNSAVWDLIHRGEIGTSLMDNSRKIGLERLIFELCGTDEVHRYCKCCEKHGVYMIQEDHLDRFTQDLFGAVVGKERILSVINSVYRTNEYIIDPQSAICYAGLQDYRARTGESRITLLFADSNPAHYQDEIQKATGLSQEFVSALIKKV